MPSAFALNSFLDGSRFFWALFTLFRSGSKTLVAILKERIAHQLVFQCLLIDSALFQKLG